MAWKLIISFIIGYVFGMFKTGPVLAKVRGIDLSKTGSGNTGMTNTMRALGKKVGIWAFVGDTLKIIIPVFITYFLFAKCGHPYPQGEHVCLFLMVTSFGGILGDMFPFYNGFKGGKGVSSYSGMVLTLLFLTGDWKFTVLGLAVFFTTMFITRYVSVGSLVLIVSIFIEFVVWGQLNMIYSLEKNPEDRIYIYIIVFIIMVLVFIRHRENLKRLANGTENKIGQKKEVK
ncbi:MAG: glycerol-3-phosphate 1-O-acyltransferase PlsY [Eubacterium sp.]|nr:glycerol-3-phosphate 1-O-acyltransferase PlsY [Eubacterium sp.]